MDLLSNIDESQWKNEDPKNIEGCVQRLQLSHMTDIQRRRRANILLKPK